MVGAVSAVAHLKWLIQFEGYRAEAGCCAVPGKVMGTAVAWTGVFHTGVINLKMLENK